MLYTIIVILIILWLFLGLLGSNISLSFPKRVGGSTLRNCSRCIPIILNLLGII